MPRVRQKIGTDPILDAPPAHYLPEGIRNLLEEYGRLFDELQRSSNDVHELRLRRWERGQLTDEQVADAARALRDGCDFVPVAEEPFDVRLQRAEQRLLAVTEAVARAGQDVIDAKRSYRESTDARRGREKASRALAKAAESFAEALRHAAANQGVTDWLDGLPYDESAYVALDAIMPAASNFGIDASDLPGVDGVAIVGALARFCD